MVFPIIKRGGAGVMSDLPSISSHLKTTDELLWFSASETSSFSGSRALAWCGRNCRIPACDSNLPTGKRINSLSGDNLEVLNDEETSEVFIFLCWSLTMLSLLAKLAFYMGNVSNWCKNPSCNRFSPSKLIICAAAVCNKRHLQLVNFCHEKNAVTCSSFGMVLSR